MAAKKWEYRRLFGAYDNWKEHFNEFGREGWELITILAFDPTDNSDTNFWGYFKREIDR